MDKLTHAQFSAQCSYMARECAHWAGDVLTLPEDMAKPIPPDVVQRFADRIRRRLEIIEKWSAPAQKEG